MKFSKVIGKIDPKVVAQCEAKMTDLFLKAALKYDASVKLEGYEGIGGDPMVFTLVAPYEHRLTDVMPTAATDGKRFYWNPDFILGKTDLGLRFVAAHEAFHAFLMHPDRCAGRIPKLWNIAVDYIVNGMIMDDLKNRNKDADKIFGTHLGKFCTVEQFSKIIKDPFNLPKELEGLFKEQSKKKFDSGVMLPQPNYEGDITDEQRKEINRRRNDSGFFFADGGLDNDFKSPEKIYAYFYQQMPKCPECGRIGMYKKPSKNPNQKNKQSGNQQGNQKGQQQGQQPGNQPGQQGNQPGQNGQGNQPGNQQGQSGGCNHGGCNHGNQQGNGQSGQGSQPGQNGNQPGQGNQQGNGQGQCDHGGCGTCGGDDSFDIFDLGDTLDEHMASEEDKEKLAARLASAIEQSKRQAGYVPAGLEAELGELVKPQIKWQDYIKSKIKRTRIGSRRSDWTRFKSRPLAYYSLIPKKKDYFVKFACLVDTSGSMSDADISYGVSQLQSLDTQAEGYIVPADAEIYYDQATEVKDCKAESLKKMKVVGRGGTAFMSFCQDYKKHFGDADFLIIITDGFLYGDELKTAHDPKIPVYWIITSDHADFKPGFGKVFHLRNGATTAK